jgi:hypothetical protein
VSGVYWHPVAPADVPAWWRDQPLTPEQIDAMHEQYAKEQIASAQSEAAFAANVKEFNRE